MLTNSGASFQRLMGHILRGLEYRFALIYTDDIIIFSKSIDENLTHLEEVFIILREANVKLNPKKCNFVKQPIEYLGHVVTPEDIFPDPSKREVVENFPTPASLKESKSFLGLANYYRRFIKGFSEIASPLKVTIDLQGCLPKNHSHARVLCYNHRKVYIIVKVIKCRIIENNFFWI